MIDMWYFVLSYVIILFIGFGLIQFLSNGFFTKFLKVKASRGKKLLIKIKSMTDTYFVTGIIDETFLVFTDRNKHNKRINVKDSDSIYRAIGVNCIDINEPDNSIIKPTGEKVTGLDAEKYDHLYQRCLQKPMLRAMTNPKLIIVVLISIGLVGFMIYKLMSMEQSIKIIASQITQLKEVGIIG